MQEVHIDSEKQAQEGFLWEERITRQYRYQPCRMRTNLTCVPYGDYQKESRLIL